MTNTVHNNYLCIITSGSCDNVAVIKYLYPHSVFSIFKISSVARNSRNVTFKPTEVLFDSFDTGIFFTAVILGYVYKIILDYVNS